MAAPEMCITFSGQPGFLFTRMHEVKYYFYPSYQHA